MSDEMSSDHQIKDGGGRVRVRAGLALIATIAAFLVLAYYAPAGAYPWIKALHVVAVISWMAALLYLPRLFVNHVALERGSNEDTLLKGMEQRLVTIIMTPALVVSWLAGLWLAWVGFQFQGGWLHIKLLSVVGLTCVHMYFVHASRQFAAGRNQHSGRYWRILNEVPAVLMILIVILVVVKPFV